MSESSVFYLGKMPTGNGDQGMWHVFKSEDASESVCRKANQGRLHQRLGLREVDLEAGDTLDDVKGLGDMCSSCREYVTGSLSDRDLPQPEKSTDKCWTGNSIVEGWKREVKAEK